MPEEAVAKIRRLRLTSLLEQMPFLLVRKLSLHQHSRFYLLILQLLLMKPLNGQKQLTQSL